MSVITNLLAGITSTLPPTGSTWDPALKGSNIILSNGNLDATKVTAGYQTAYGTQGHNSGRYVFECLVTALPNISSILIGIADKTNSAAVITTYLGDNGGSPETIGYNDNNGSGDGRLFRRMTIGSIGGLPGTVYVGTQVITVDVDFVDNTCTYYRNGVATSFGAIPITSGKTYFPGVSLQSNAAARLITTGLTYLPSGATAWG